ncbi:MAG: FtsX-like permease family protein [Pseudomonadota bacterium]|nr:FtsX-like permease family protein [Pseudomonadota bacterium]
MAATELLLDRDPSSRFVPWIVAALSLVVTIALATALALAALTANWGERAAAQVSLRLPADMPDARVDDLVRRIGALPEVERIEHLPRARVADLLRPWLGAGADAGPDLLPLPVIIDVRLVAGGTAAAIERALAGVPDVSIDRPDQWLRPLQHLASLARLVAFALAAVALGAIVLVTVFATRSAMVNHRPTIELLRLIGAEDGYLARRFQFHGLKLALVGGLAGTVPGLIVTGFAVGAVRLDGADLLAGMAPPLAGWIAIGAIPLLVALVAMLTARWTVFSLLEARW